MRLKTLLGTWALTLLIVSQVAARPITHEDVWTMRRLGAPAVSPDGKWAVFSVSEPSYDKEKQVSDLWLAPTDGSKKPRRLTSTPSSEGGVSWSPSGDRIVFTAKRGKDEVRQLYVMNMTGPGEAQRVTDFPLSCSSPKFTPDGKKIVFESLVYPDAGTDAESQAEAKKAVKDRKEKVSSYEGFPIRYWDHWLDGRHPRPYLLTLGAERPPVDILVDTKLVEEVGFSGVPGLSGESLQSTISPDGKELLFVATINRHRAVKDSTLYRIYRCPLTGGEPSEVKGPDGSRFDPTFGPAGKLYSTYSPHNEFVYTLTDLIVQDWPPNGNGKNLTTGSDHSVGEFVVGSDKVFFTANWHGRRRIFSLKPGQAPKPLDPKSRVVFSGLGLAGKNLVCRYEDGAKPVEFVRVTPQGKMVRLSDFNRTRSAAIDWPPFREFWFESEKGRKIHSWLVLPPGFSESRKYPLVLFIHGGPHSTSLDKGHVRWSPQLLAAGGYVVLLTDYTGSVGYGEKFAQAIQGDPLKTPGDELEQAVEEAITRYPFIDGTRVAASGASYGGHMVNWLQATSDRFKCLVGHAGLISLEGQWSTSDAVSHREKNLDTPPWEGNPIWKEQSPHTYVSNFKTPVMLTIGEKDYRVPLNQTLAAWTYLQRMNVPSKLLVYHQANHWIMSGPDAKHFWGEVHSWLDKYLK